MKVYVIYELEMYEGEYVRGIYTNLFLAEQDMLKLKLSNKDPEVFSFRIETLKTNCLLGKEL
jgi:hypothetical protein